MQQFSGPNKTFKAFQIRKQEFSTDFKHHLFVSHKNFKVRVKY